MLDKVKTILLTSFLLEPTENLSPEDQELQMDCLKELPEKDNKNEPRPFFSDAQISHYFEGLRAKNKI